MLEVAGVTAGVSFSGAIVGGIVGFVIPYVAMGLFNEEDLNSSSEMLLKI